MKKILSLLLVVGSLGLSADNSKSFKIISDPIKGKIVEIGLSEMKEFLRQKDTNTKINSELIDISYKYRKLEKEHMQLKREFADYKKKVQSNQVSKTNKKTVEKKKQSKELYDVSKVIFDKRIVKVGKEKYTVAGGDYTYNSFEIEKANHNSKWFSPYIPSTRMIRGRLGLD